MSLPTLPYEVLYMIADLISPDDIVNFAGCCTIVRAICRARLEEHSHFKNRYSSLSFDGRFSDKDQLLEVLSDIALQPRIVYYPVSLHISQLESEWIDQEVIDMDPSLDPGGVQLYSKSLIPSIEPLLEDCRTLLDDDNELDLWKSSLKDGDEGPSIAVLLSLLPHLQKITFKYAWPALELNTLLTRISQAFDDGGSRLLPQLHSVKIYGEEGGTKDEYCQLVNLSVLRPLRRIEWTGPIATSPVIVFPSGNLAGLPMDSTMWLRDEDVDLLPPQWKDAYLQGTGCPSFVESLSLHDCYLNHDFLALLLQRFVSLKKFSHTCSMSHILHAYPANYMFTIRRMLMCCATFSLTHLTLRSFFKHHNYIGPLNTFKVLTTINLQFSMLQDDVYMRTETLARVLPTSVQFLEINDTLWSNLSNLFHDFNPYRFPDLRAITFRCSDHGHICHTDSEHFDDELAAMGATSKKRGDIQRTQWKRIRNHLNAILLSLADCDVECCPYFSSDSAIGLYRQSEQGGSPMIGLAVCEKLFFCRFQCECQEPHPSDTKPLVNHFVKVEGRRHRARIL